ncbi:LOW QUALITY PROTEIN: hypothetical protein Cgig2_012879 [Carnegiea gigantea]|uniref:Neurochondrin n=1 Tax=Carnegiea gigantea TaxID=171969 RepID=A0A9Q1JYR0_9CARY|nr:LOW QUALITY PROTEIN: hypothetical protein Cgig2_012879 [Carnegiea gigantea]
MLQEVEQENQQQVPGLEDCLKLLRGERDEQRLAGLLLVTKLCNKDDHDSIRKVYEAVGTRFLDRLLRTGKGHSKFTGWISLFCLVLNLLWFSVHRRRRLPCRCRQHSAEREREGGREGAVRSPVFVAWESNAVIGGKPNTCWALGLREPPTSPSPAAGCSLLGFSRASGEFLRSCLRGVGFYSVEVTAGLVGGFCPRRHISRRRLFRLPEFRWRTVSEGLFRAQPGGGDGFDGVNSSEPFPPWAGMAKGNTASGENENRDAYLQLSISVLAAFSRVPEIAASADMVSKIPSVLQVMEKEPASSLLEDCYELLLLISSASERGVATFFECGGLKLLATHLSSFSDGSQLLDLSMRLVMLVLGKISLDDIVSRYLTELSILVACVGRQFALLQDAMKFDLLQLLCAVLSSNHSVSLHNALRAMSNDKWPAYIRAGVVDILQNRVAPDQKLQALIVAESMISILGEHWLTAQMHLPDLQISFPSDRCLLLVLESARVEIAVVLNEVAYIMYEAPSSKAEELTLKRRNLAIAFSLVERIIKLISNLSEDEVLEYLKDAKVMCAIIITLQIHSQPSTEDEYDHGQKKGDDLLACVRLVGRHAYIVLYLAEAPLACKEKVKELLGYLLSIEGEDESRVLQTQFFDAIAWWFSGQVVKCLLQLVSADPNALEDSGRIYLACDIVMNILLKREHIKVQLDESVFVDLLKALVYWADRTNDSSTIMMASSICSLIFDITSEEALLRYPEFGMSTYQKLCHLIVRSLALYGQEMCDDSKSDTDLHQIIAGGYSRWADRFPLLRRMVEQ